MADQLSLFNAALVELGEKRIANLSVQEKAREELDAVYSDVKSDCLASGLWNFALRTTKLQSDTGVTPNFGHQEVFDKPSDWVRTAAFASDEYFRNPLADHQFEDEAGFWATDVTPIYVKYISNDSSYGEDLSKWPVSYRRYVEVSLADRVCMAITQDGRLKDQLERMVVPRAFRRAKAHDAMNEGTKFPRESSWNAVRRGASRRERGSISSLHG